MENKENIDRENEINEDLDTEPEIEEIEAEIVTDIEDQEEVEKSQMSEADVMRDKFIRLQADFTNYKRRTEQEKKDYVDLGVEKVMNGLLPIIDNFERALSMNTDGNKFSEGIDMIYKQLIELLDKNGVKEMDALNASFDPNAHHAVMSEAREGIEEGIVIEVLQKGYMLGEKVLRPAMVKISQ